MVRGRVNSRRTHDCHLRMWTETDGTLLADWLSLKEMTKWIGSKSESKQVDTTQADSITQSVYSTLNAVATKSCRLPPSHKTRALQSALTQTQLPVPLRVPRGAPGEQTQLISANKQPKLHLDWWISQIWPNRQIPLTTVQMWGLSSLGSWLNICFGGGSVLCCIWMLFYPVKQIRSARRQRISDWHHVDQQSWWILLDFLALLNSPHSTMSGVWGFNCRLKEQYPSLQKWRRSWTWNNWKL